MNHERKDKFDRSEPQRPLRETLRRKDFELIMLWGDAGKENGLRVDSVTSKLYEGQEPSKVKKTHKDEEEEEECVLRIDVPSSKLPWIALFKVSCLEGNELAHHPRHYALKVVAVEIKN